MTKVGLLLMLIVGSFTGYAQKFPSELWHTGKVVLETGDTLKGSIKYDLQSDLIQFSTGSSLDLFTARKLTFFEIFDELTKRYRQFYSIPYTTSGAYKAPVFFELLTEGKMTLLCRESIEYRTYSNSFYSYGTSSRLVLVYNYFLLNDKGEIEPFVGKRADLLALMGNQAPLVQKYMKSNKLDPAERNEFVQIVQYYNSLSK